MKKIILGLVALTTLATSFSARAAIDWDNLESGMGKIAEISALKTDLYFCVTMSGGVKYTASQDTQILSLLGCDDVISNLDKLGVEKEEILATVERGQRTVALDEIERCADNVIIGKKSSCAQEVQTAKDLGLTEEDIREELGIIAGFAL